MPEFESFDESQLRDKLENCNHTMTKGLLVRQFSGGVIPKPLAALLDAYIANPCAETAIKLVKFDQEFIAFFELACQGGFTESLFRKGDLVVEAKTTEMLQHEPEFKEYCDSITDDIERHKQLKAQFRSKGYPDELIDEAFSEYWRDMDSDT